MLLTLLKPHILSSTIMFSFHFQYVIFESLENLWENAKKRKKRGKVKGKKSAGK